jgi:hypothetical protein
LDLIKSCIPISSRTSIFEVNMATYKPLSVSLQFYPNPIFKDEMIKDFNKVRKSALGSSQRGIQKNLLRQMPVSGRAQNSVACT